MFFKLFALFAVLAVAFANPKPQVLTYTAGASGGVVPLTYSAGYSPLAYSSPYIGAAPVPYVYSGYPY